MGDDAPQAPAGWYQDPDKPGTLRYWDGETWSDSPAKLPPQGVQRQTPTAAGGGRAPWIDRAAEQPGVFWAAVLAAIAMGVGAVGTWATALGFISIAGTTGGDGQVVLVSAVVALLALWAFALRARTWTAAVAALAGVVGATVTGIDLHKLSGIGTANFFGNQVRLVHAGWGIEAALGASVALIVLTFATVASSATGALRREERFGAGAAAGAGVGVLAAVLALGAVIAVAHVGTHSPSGEAEQANNAASARSSETAAAASTEQTTPSTAEASGPPPSSTPPALEELESYWSDIGSRDYAGAYAHLAPGAAGLSEAQFIESEQGAGIEHVSFSGRVAEAATGSAVTVDVSSLTTEDHRYGCRTWSGSYQMAEEGGTWLIRKASLTPHPCG